MVSARVPSRFKRAIRYVYMAHLVPRNKNCPFLCVDPFKRSVAP